jgi:hypothetical protein
MRWIRVPQTLTKFFKLEGIPRGDIFMSIDRRPINSGEIKQIVQVGQPS